MTDLKEETYWSRYARNYDEYAEYVVGKSLRTALAERLSQERGLGKVIEFGCGTGFFTGVISQNAEHIHATDLSDKMLLVAKENLAGCSNITLERADCEQTEYPAERFDAVFMANLLHAVERPELALRESRRILKRGGLLLVVLYTDYGMTWIERVELSFRYFLKFGMPPPYGLRNYAPEELGRLVTDAGFSVEVIELIGDKPKGLYLMAAKENH